MTTGRINQVTTAAPASGPHRRLPAPTRPRWRDTRGFRHACESHPYNGARGTRHGRGNGNAIKSDAAAPPGPVLRPRSARAHPEPLQRPFKFPPKRSTVRRPAHARARPEGRNTWRARSDAQSKGAPLPVGRLFSVPSTGGMHPRRSAGRTSQWPATHGTHP
jgi:hypothetical protein